MGTVGRLHSKALSEACQGRCLEAEKSSIGIKEMTRKNGSSSNSDPASLLQREQVLGKPCREKPHCVRGFKSLLRSASRKAPSSPVQIQAQVLAAL